jgi:hypothetical protein
MARSATRASSSTTASPSPTTSTTKSYAFLTQIITVTSPSRRPASTRLRVSRILESRAFDDLIGVLRAAANSQHSLDSDSDECESLENAKHTPFTSIDR